MKFNRRQFIKGASSAAALAGAHVLGFAANSARAAGAGAPILVLINLRGGNDALNTVVPLDNVGAPQRSLYQSLRPSLAIPTSALAATEIDPDPALGTGLALNPALSDMWSLYDEGRLAVVNGIGVVDCSLSHFDAEAVWYTGDATSRQNTGWLGRHLDALWRDGEIRAMSFGSAINETLASLFNDVLGVRSITRFSLPDDRERQYRDLDTRRLAWQSIFADSRAAGVTARIARSGGNLVSKSELLGRVAVDGWGSYNEGERGLGRNLREIASLLRHDDLDPGDASGVCFFHCGTGGYDTHSRQGTLLPDGLHAPRLDEFSRTLHGFQRDLDGLGLADRVITVAYSEFGRRAVENDTGANAGTDHGRAGTLFAVGNPVLGGLYGQVPRLDRLDRNGCLEVNTDFRTVYAALIDHWLGGDHTALLPGGPFTPLPFIR
jgi:uncharacterized protein (DUF1501 family)